MKRDQEDLTTPGPRVARIEQGYRPLLIYFQDYVGSAQSSLAREMRKRSFVTHAELGTKGEFGNQLFQIALVLGYAAKYGVRPILPRWSCEGSRTEYWRLYPGLDYRDSIQHWAQYEECRFAYQNLPFRFNLTLKGHFQSEKYFPTLRSELLRLFREPAVAEEVKAFQLQNQLGRYDAMHMRFYVRHWDDTPAFEPSLADAYYVQALQALESTGNLLLIVTNDVQRATAFVQRQGIKRPYLITSNADSLVDFYLISRAQNIVISNSTFSWWAAYLSTSAGSILAPTHRKWFAPPFSSRPDIDCSDLIPDRFRQIDF